MKPPQDPPRLLDPGSDAPAWLRSSLEAGARDLPGPARLARIAGRLPGAPTGSGPGAPRPPVAPVAPAVPSAFSGAAIGAALGLAVVGAGWIASRPAASPPPPPPAQIAAVAAVSSEPLLLEPAKTPSLQRRPPSFRPAPLPGATASPAASAGTDPAASAGDIVSPSGPSLAEPSSPAAETETETAILLRAHEALGGSPALALALTDLHLARFPGGTFVQEREVIAVQALLGMGRRAEARARARRFVTAFPASADRRRLEVLIPDLESSPDSKKAPGDRPSTL